MQLNNRKLKVKIKSLAAEAQIIRKEERKELSQAGWFLDEDEPNTDAAFPHLVSYEKLRKHRREDVRNEARCAQLVYAIIRNKEYADTEHPDTTFERRMECLSRLTELVAKYCHDLTGYELRSKSERVHNILGSIRAEVRFWLYINEQETGLMEDQMDQAA